MDFENLNLDKINDEVLDECFYNDNDTFQYISTLDAEVLNDDDIKPKKLKYKDVLPAGETNESIMLKIRNGIDVKKNTEIMVRCNSGLVYQQSKSCTCNIPFEDKLQYGYEGLLRAIKNYKPELNVSFSTYASSTIHTTLYNFGNNDVRLVTLPRYQSVVHPM